MLSGIRCELPKTNSEELQSNGFKVTDDTGSASLPASELDQLSG